MPSTRTSTSNKENNNNLQSQLAATKTSQIPKEGETIYQNTVRSNGTSRASWHTFLCFEDSKDSISRLLKKNGCLSDPVIDSYLSLLEDWNQQQPKHKAPFNITCLPCNFAIRVANSERLGSKYPWLKRVQQVVNNAKDSRNGLIMVPCHQDFHWFLVCVSVKTRDISIYNSQVSSLPYYSKMLAAIKTALNIPNLFQLSNSQATIMETPKQRGGSECGVFLLMFANYIATNRALPYATDNHKALKDELVNSLRLKLYLQLQSSEINHLQVNDNVLVDHEKFEKSCLVLQEAFDRQFKEAQKRQHQALSLMDNDNEQPELVFSRKI